MRFNGEGGYNNARFTADMIRAAATDLWQKHPDKKLIVVTDGWVAYRGPSVLTYPDDKHRIAGEAAGSLFLLAMDNDEIAEKAVRDIVAAGGKYVPVVVGLASYHHHNFVWRKAAHEESMYQRDHGYTYWDMGDFDNLAQAIEITKHLDGSYVEVGTFRGSSGGAALCYMQAAKMKRNCFFFDVFEGFDYEAAKESADAIWFGTHKTEGMDAVANRLTRFRSDLLNVTVERRNIITDQIPESVGRIAVINIDVDIYEGILAGLEKCAPRMLPGGIIILEDVGHTPGLIGAKVALEDFKATNLGKQFTGIYMASGQYWLLKKEGGG
ncbi:TylF/MycF/NovP-related O-methyltransferase [uncultured Enterovirga sp.]|uniref:TylF/MycF/NovP-related O-methyltransferase n=1 Tax=uncultured Enterovirga sp. TaxID=2026352 RepID=UPI0035CBAA8F